jgi:hypothetical protein
MVKPGKILIAGSLFLTAVCALFAQNDVIKQLSVDVDIVLVPVTVTNELGQFVSGLEKHHFQVYEDKIAQTITQFSTEDAPMSLGIVLDSSGSMNPVMNTARRYRRRRVFPDRIFRQTQGEHRVHSRSSKAEDGAAQRSVQRQDRLVRRDLRRPEQG